MQPQSNYRIENASLRLKRISQLLYPCAVNNLRLKMSLRLESEALASEPVEDWQAVALEQRTMSSLCSQKTLLFSPVVAVVACLPAEPSLRSIVTRIFASLLL